MIMEIGMICSCNSYPSQKVVFMQETYQQWPKNGKILYNFVGLKQWNREIWDSMTWVVNLSYKCHILYKIALSWLLVVVDIVQAIFFYYFQNIGRYDTYMGISSKPILAISKRKSIYLNIFYSANANASKCDINLEA